MNSNVYKWAMGAVLLVAAGCSSQEADKSSFGGDNTSYENNYANNTTNNASGIENNSINNSTNNVFIPEVETEYDFSAPAVVGGRVFVANETLNSVSRRSAARNSR